VKAWALLSLPGSKEHIVPSVWISTSAGHGLRVLVTAATLGAALASTTVAIALSAALAAHSAR